MASGNHELNVQAHTSVADLRQFLETAAAKRSGLLEAKQNKDGSLTLYVAPQTRSRSRWGDGLFGGWARARREQRQSDAKKVIDQIFQSFEAPRSATLRTPTARTAAPERLHTSELAQRLQVVQAPSKPPLQAASDLRAYESLEPFANQPAETGKGMTGSAKVRATDGRHYQLKSSIAHASWLRRWKAGGLNVENYGEVIASRVAQSVLPDAERGLIPEVSLRQSGADHEAKISSQYLAYGQGDLDAYYQQGGGSLPKGHRHVKVDLSASPAAEKPGVLHLSGEAAQDVCRNLALSALVGDHDVNPGNMVAVQKPGEPLRIGRIDFGHAFHELIMAPGGKACGGGGVHDPGGNRILDFFNRESVSGNPFVRGNMRPKLWRDYQGAVPSKGLAKALNDLASGDDYLVGLAQSKAQFLMLAVDLQTEGTPPANKQLKELVQSLSQISENIGKPVAAGDPVAAIEQIFINLKDFFVEGQQQMKQVAGLCQLQAQIDQHLASGGTPADLPEDLQASYKTLLHAQGGTVLTWMKCAAHIPAFEGTLEAYVQHRQATRTQET